MFYKNFKQGFTLAEVLITLGIIGVVAAVTIPTLIANTRANKYRSVFKKTVSTLSQAARMADAQYDYDYAGITDRCGNNAASEHPEVVRSICAMLNGTLTGSTYYDKVTDIKINKNSKFENYSIIPGPFMGATPSRNIENFRAYVLSDGVILGIYKGLGSAPCSMSVASEMNDFGQFGANLENCVGFIDVNGVSLPNKEVSCSIGSNSLSRKDCIVKNDAKHMTDIYPIRFHDGIVEPASAAARYVLKSAK